MIVSQTTRPRCSRLKLDDVATPTCPFVLVSVALYAFVYDCVSLCMQTDHPQTGNAARWGGSEPQEWDGCTALNTCDIRDLLCPTWCLSTIPLIMNDPCQSKPIQRLVFDTVPLAMHTSCMGSTEWTLVLCHILNCIKRTSRGVYPP